MADTVTFNTAGTTTWTCPAGVNTLQVECWGGGGAGGGGVHTSAGSNTSQNGGGGGGGAYARRISVPVTPGNNYTITIPAAAVSGANGTANGAGQVNGGTVTFTGDGAVTVTAAGGTGGKWCNVGGTNVTSSAGGGAGGTTAASVGDAGAVFAGGAGSTGNTGSTSVPGSGGGGAGNAAAGGNAVTNTGSTTAGSGGIAGGGAGGVGRGSGNGTSYAGNPGLPPGGGGAAAKNCGNSTTYGGTGGLGQIVITYTVSVNVKANNTDDLDLASSWTVGVPATTDVATWNNTVTTANTAALGADLTFGGLAILNPGGMVTLNGPNTLTLGAAATAIDMSAATADLSLNCPLALGADNIWNVALSRTLTVGGAVSGGFAVTKQGVGTVTLSGTNTYTGVTTINSGLLQVNTVADSGTSAIGFSTTSTTTSGGLTFTGAGTFEFNGTSQTATTARGIFANSVAPTLQIDTGNSLTFTGIFSSPSTVTFVKSGAGTLVTAANSGINSGNNNNVNFNVTGGTLVLQAAGIAANGITDIANGATVMLGAGGGPDQIWDGNGADIANAAGVTINSGGTFDLNGTSEALTQLAGTSSTAVVTNSSSTAATLTVGTSGSGTANNASSTYAGKITGALSLTKAATGTLALAGANSFNGATTVNAGTLKIGVTGGGTAVSIANNSFESPTTLSYVYTPTNASWTFNANSGYARNTWFSTNPPAGSQAGFLQGSNAFISQAVSVSTPGVYAISFAAEGRGGTYGPQGVIVKVDGTAVAIWTASDVSQSAWKTYVTGVYLTAGTHKLEFDGNNTLGGDKSVSIDNVTMTLATSNGSLPVGTAVNLTATGASFDLSGTSQTVSSLTGAAGSSVINGNLTTGGDDSSTEFAGGFGGTASLTKTGAGTLTLSGASTHSGNTTVNGGTLALANTGGLTFRPTANGVCNKIGGTATATFNGAFTIDLTNADGTSGNAWLLVDVGSLGTSFGTTFQVVGFTQQSSGVWIMTDSRGKWTFATATGTLGLFANSYTIWAAAQSPPLTGGASAVGTDGLANLMIYAIDGLKTDHTNGAPGALTGNLLTFTKRSDAIASGDVAWAIQTSPDLVTWTTQVSQPKGDPTPTISYNLSGGSGELFARLVVSQ